MLRDEAIAIIRKEYLCVDRDCGVEKNCGKCDLVLPNKEPILEAFKMAIRALEQELYGDAISRHDAIFLAGELRHDLPDDDDDRLAATVMAHNEGILEYQTKLSLLPSINQEPCEDAISREAVDTLVDELARAISDERCHIPRGRSTAAIMQDILDLPSVTPQPEEDCYTCKHRYYETWRCVRCRVRFPSHYERRE